MTDRYEAGLRPADRAVVDGLESMEVVYGAGQPDYAPLRALKAPDGRIITRWTLSDRQREAVSRGADIFVSMLTFNEPLQPLQLLAATELDPASVVETLGMDIPPEMIDPEVK